MLVDCSKTTLLLNYKENLSFMVDIYGIWIGPHRSLSHRRSLCRWSKTTLIVWQQRQGARIAWWCDSTKTTVWQQHEEMLLWGNGMMAMMRWQYSDDLMTMKWCSVKTSWVLYCASSYTWHSCYTLYANIIMTRIMGPTLPWNTHPPMILTIICKKFDSRMMW